MKDRLVWVDCEMTGLDLSRDSLVEVAAVVTDGQLEMLGPGLDVVIAPPQAALDGMEPVVRDMHQQSGLLEAIAASTVDLATAERRLLDHIRQWVPEPGRVPLCGNSVATDRAFLARDMPMLDRWLHYRMVDVSSIKELCRRWYPRAYHQAPAKQGGHRALADVVESIEELRYYRSNIFVSADVAAPAPGAAAAAAVPDPGTVVAD